MYNNTCIVECRKSKTFSYHIAKGQQLGNLDEFPICNMLGLLLKISDLIKTRNLYLNNISCHMNLIRLCDSGLSDQAFYSSG